MIRRSLMVAAVGIGLLLLLSLAVGRRATPQAAVSDTFPSPPAQKPEVREKQARRVEEILQTIDSQKEQPASGKEHKISEEEFNSYLAGLIQAESPPGVEALFVHLEEKSFTVFAIVDVDQIPKEGKDTATRVLMQTVLAGKQYLSANGSLVAKDGMGSFTLASARVNAMEVPLPLVNVLINSVTRKKHGAFDLSKPFRLPYGIREVEVHHDYLVVS